MKNIGSYSGNVYLLCCFSTYRLLCKLVMHLKILTDSAKCVGTQGPALETLGHLGIPEPRWHFTFPLQTILSPDCSSQTRQFWRRFLQQTSRLPHFPQPNISLFHFCDVLFAREPTPPCPRDDYFLTANNYSCVELKKEHRNK